MKLKMLTGLSVVFLVGALVFTPASEPLAERSETYRQLNLFGDVFSRIRTTYVEEVDDVEMIEAAINGMLTSLDPHSSYLNAERFEDMQVQTKGEFGGLGIEVTMENGLVKVISPIDDTPAERAGVEAGDFITGLDGEPVMGLTLSEAVDIMRGEPGSKLTVTIARRGERSQFDIDIIRDIIKIQSIRSEAKGKTGYIRVTTFNEQAEPGLKKAFAELSEEIGPEMNGIVLDLRSNPGGLLDQAVAIADAFLDRGEVVQTRGRDPQDVQRYHSRGGDILEGKPLIVLINGGSASASEIVAGALQDYKRAIVVGTKSFGKGSVQTIIPLGRENGAMRLTTARYYTPAGRSIQAEGIEPDLVVEQAKIEKLDGDDRPRRSEATLRGHLMGEDEAEEAAAEDELPLTDEDLPEGEGDESSTDRAAEDYQLSYALDLMKGLALVYNRSTSAASLQ
ncbi:MAG: S41 family peptidase [Alphaproteobacteria bacterium]